MTRTVPVRRCVGAWVRRCEVRCEVPGAACDVPRQIENAGPSFHSVPRFCFQPEAWSLLT